LILLHAFQSQRTPHTKNVTNIVSYKGMHYLFFHVFKMTFRTTISCENEYYEDRVYGKGVKAITFGPISHIT